jgi:hypothetical protein
MASKDELRQSLKDYHGTWIKVRLVLTSCSIICLLFPDQCMSLQLSPWTCQMCVHGCVHSQSSRTQWLSGSSRKYSWINYCPLLMHGFQNGAHAAVAPPGALHVLLFCTAWSLGMCPCSHSSRDTAACMRMCALQDGAASDSLEPAIRLIHLNRVMRQAVRLIRGVQLGIEQDQLRFSVFSAIPWFKVSGWVCRRSKESDLVVHDLYTVQHSQTSQADNASVCSL